MARKGENTGPYYIQNTHLEHTLEHPFYLHLEHTFRNYISIHIRITFYPTRHSSQSCAFLTPAHTHTQAFHHITFTFRITLGVSLHYNYIYNLHYNYIQNYIRITLIIQCSIWQSIYAPTQRPLHLEYIINVCFTCISLYASRDRHTL